VAATKATGATPAAGQAPQDSAAAGDAAATPPTCPRPADVVFEGVARLRGEPVTVLVSGPQDHQVIELVDTTCAVVFSQPL
jgi:hypothetical protein